MLINMQLENGYTRIANELLEQVAKVKLNGTQLRIILILWRSTYGWEKKSYGLSEGYLGEATKIDKRRIHDELNKLIEMDIITVVRGATFTTAREISFNKNYDEWKLKTIR